MNNDEKERILKWAGYRHYKPNDPSTYWIAPNSDGRAVFEPNLDSLDVLMEIVERKCLQINLSNFEGNAPDHRWRLYSLFLPENVYAKTPVEALQNALLKLAEADNAK